MQRNVSTGPRFSAIGSEPIARAASFHNPRLRDIAAANYLTHKREQRNTAAIVGATLAYFYGSACALLGGGAYVMQYGSPIAGLYLSLSGLALLAYLLLAPRAPH